MSEEKTLGQLACETFWASVKAGPRDAPVSMAWNWARSQGTQKAWEAAAEAVAEAIGEMSGARDL